MKNRTLFVVITSVALVVLISLWWSRDRNEAEVPPKSQKLSEGGATKQKDPSNSQANGPFKFRVKLTSGDAPAPTPRPAVVKLSNSGDHAILKRATGTVIWRAAKEGKPLYGATQSPNGQLVILDFGDGKHELYRLDPFVKIKQLPTTAPVERGTAISPWAWIDNDHLLGVSAIERSEESLNGLTAAEKEATWCEKMLLYVYHLDRSELQQVPTDRLEFPPVFEVIKIAEGGRLQIGAEILGKAWQSVWITVEIE